MDPLHRDRQWFPAARANQFQGGFDACLPDRAPRPGNYFPAGHAHAFHPTGSPLHEVPGLPRDHILSVRSDRQPSMNLDVAAILTLVSGVCILAVPVAGIAAAGIYLRYLIRRRISPDHWFVPRRVVRDFRFLASAPGKLDRKEKVVLSNAYIILPVRLVRGAVFFMVYSLGTQLAADAANVIPDSASLNYLAVGLALPLLPALLVLLTYIWCERWLSVARGMDPGTNLSRVAKKLSAKSSSQHRRLLATEGRRFLRYTSNAGVPDTDPRIVRIRMFLDEPTGSNLASIPATVHLTLVDIVTERFTTSSRELNRAGKWATVVSVLGLGVPLLVQLMQLVQLARRF